MSESAERKLKIVAFVREFRETYGYAPTLRQIGESCDYASVAGVHNAVWALISEGRLAGSPGRSLHVPDRVHADG